MLSAWISKFAIPSRFVAEVSFRVKRLVYGDDKRRIDDLSGPVTVEAVIADLRAITQSRKKKAFQGYPHLISYRLKQLRALYEQRHYGKLTRAEEHYLQQLSNALYSV